jgi:hypothetical protein
MKSSPLVLVLLAAGCLETPSPSSDAGVVGTPDGGVGEPCGTTRALREEFDVLGPLWEGWGNVTGATADGRRQIYGATDTEGGLNTTWSFLAAGGEVVVALRGVGLGEGGYFYVQLLDSNDDAVGIFLDGATLSLQVYVDGSMTSPDSTGWTEDLLWWRLREEGGQLWWAVSNDGDSWQEHEPIDNPLAALVGLVFGLGGGSVQSVVEIDAVNPESTELECPAASLVDEFDALSPRWARTETTACTVTTDGRLVIEYGEDGFCGIRSREHFDLRGSAMAIDVVDAGDCDPAFGFAVDIGGLSAEIQCHGTPEGVTLAAGLYGEGGPGALASLPYDPMSHRLWRIANPAGSGQLTWSVATAAGDWEVIASTPVDDDTLAAAGVNLLVSDDTAGGVIEEVVLDRFNLVP